MDSSSNKKTYTIFDTKLGLGRKKRLLMILMTLSVVMLSGLGATAFLEGHRLLALGDALAASLLISSAVYLAKTGNLRLTAWVGLCGIGALFLFLLIDGGVNFSAYVWIFTYPILTIYLLGSMRGLIMVSIVLGIFSGVRLFAPQLLGANHPYSVDFLLRFYASLGVTTFVAVYMDLAWKEAQQVIEKKNELLQNLSRLDGLTGIYNRRHFDEELDKQWSQVQRNNMPLSLLMIDVDHFKRYNDRYGHQAGDNALVNVAMVLCQQASRKIDVAARYGGEEFAVVLPGTGFAGAVNVSRKILQKLHDMNIEHAEGNNGRLTASIGIACVDDKHQYESAAELIKIADGALYAAKQGGRNTYQPKPLQRIPTIV